VDFYLENDTNDVPVISFDLSFRSIKTTKTLSCLYYSFYVFTSYLSQQQISSWCLVWTDTGC